MTKDKTQLLRLIFIDRKIREGMKSGILANCSSMAREYEVSTKSILRDIDYLKHQRNAPIEYDPSRKGYYYTEERYELPAIDINESDLFAIYVTDRLMAEYENTPVYTHLKSVFDKIEKSLTGKIAMPPHWIDSRLSVVPESRTTIAPEVWETVAKGISTCRTLQIDYQKAIAGTVTHRKVDTYHIARYQGEWYLIGYCHLRASILTFAMSRIRAAKILNQLYDIPADFDYGKSAARNFGIFSSNKLFEVAIRFDRETSPFVIERQWHPSQKFISEEEGSVVMEMTVSHLQEILRWVLSWGSGAQVLSPPELIAMVRRELQEAVNYYDT